MTKDELRVEALRLRALGNTYKSIGDALGISDGAAWQLCNRERHLENCRQANAANYNRRRLAASGDPDPFLYPVRKGY